MFLLHNLRQKKYLLGIIASQVVKELSLHVLVKIMQKEEKLNGKSMLITWSIPRRLRVEAASGKKIIFHKFFIRNRVSPSAEAGRKKRMKKPVI